MAEKKPVAGNKKKKPLKKPTKNNTKKKQSRNKSDNTKKVTQVKQKYVTHTGETLSTLQGKFVDLYIELGNQRQAVIQAGYKQKNPDWQANALLRIPKIADEVNWRMQQMHKKSIATAEEVMEFYTKVMRGEVKDQFELDAPLADRIKAGNELAKRLVDIPNKLEGKAQATVTISLDWEGMEDTGDGEEEDGRT